MDSTGFSLSLITDDIVISGIGGRYPESESLDEFRDNLFANVDMITEDDRRWPPGKYRNLNFKINRFWFRIAWNQSSNGNAQGD